MLLCGGFFIKARLSCFLKTFANGDRWERSNTCVSPTRFSTWPRNSKASKEASEEAVAAIAVNREVTMVDVEVATEVVADGVKEEVVAVEEERDIGNKKENGLPA